MADINKFLAWMDKSEDLKKENADDLYEGIFPWGDRRTCMMLNYAVGCLDAQESYLEVGTFCGGSLAGAMQGNTAIAQVIDPLHHTTAKGTCWDIWNSVIDEQGLRDRVVLHREFCEKVDPEKIPEIGVYFYDGDHNSGHTYEGLKRFESRLSDRAIVIVDDYLIGGGVHEPFPGHELDTKLPVKSDTDRWVAETDAATLVTVTSWFNAQAVIIYER